MSITAELTLPAANPIPCSRVVSRADWRTARIRLLAREKELTRARDVLNEERRALPVVLVEKDYVLDTPAGPAPYDFHATTDEAVAPVEYNYRSKEELERIGQHHHVKGEQPGASVFLRDGDRVFHSYSTYGRGLDALLTTHSWLDLTPFGRGEGWDGMPGLQVPLRHHDRY